MILKSAFLLLILSNISGKVYSKTPPEEFEIMLGLSNKNIVLLDKILSPSKTKTLLDVSYNKISNVNSSAFVDTPNLIYLDLTGNPIDSLNLNLSNLETLVLNGALRNFSGPPGRTYLSIGTKPSLGVPAGLYLPKLKKLFLRNNTIIQLAGLTAETVPNLTHLYLSNNNIEYLDFIDKLPKSITHLYLDNNKISNFVHKRSRIESSGWCAVAKMVTEKYDFNHLENLKYLDMSHNKIEVIEDHTFKNSSKLISFRLNNNSLFSMPDFSGLTQIAELDLSYNNIKGIFPPMFNYLSSLKDLKIFGNPEAMDLKESDMEYTS